MGVNESEWNLMKLTKYLSMLPPRASIILIPSLPVPPFCFSPWPSKSPQQIPAWLVSSHLATISEGAWSKICKEGQWVGVQSSDANSWGMTRKNQVWSSQSAAIKGWTEEMKSVHITMNKRLRTLEKKHSNWTPNILLTSVLLLQKEIQKILHRKVTCTDRMQPVPTAASPDIWREMTEDLYM